MFGNVDRETGEVTVTGNASSINTPWLYDPGTVGRFCQDAGSDWNNKLNYGPQVWFNQPGNWSGDYWKQRPQFMKKLQLTGERNGPGYYLRTTIWYWTQPGNSADTGYADVYGTIEWPSVFHPRVLSLRAGGKWLSDYAPGDSFNEGMYYSGGRSTSQYGDGKIHFCYRGGCSYFVPRYIRLTTLEWNENGALSTF